VHAAGCPADGGHCSILVKAVGGASGAPTDLLASHTTWSGFDTLTRVCTSGLRLPLDGEAGRGAVQGGLLIATVRLSSPRGVRSSRDRRPLARSLPCAVAFSSYPAAPFSDDDWCGTRARAGAPACLPCHPCPRCPCRYLTSARLAVTETTIANNNASLWAWVRPDTVLGVGAQHRGEPPGVLRRGVGRALQPAQARTVGQRCVRAAWGGLVNGWP